MRKLLLALLFVQVLCGYAIADDFWVYIRTEDRYIDTNLYSEGRSKKGDIVYIREASSMPTLTEQSEYAIFKITSVDYQTLATFLESWPDYAYRKYTVREWVEELNIPVGIYPSSINYNTIKNKFRLKTTDDLARYKRGTQFYALKKKVKNTLAKIFEPAVMVLPAYAQTITTSKLCDTGDNCTDEDYNSLIVWEDAHDGDLVGEERVEIAELYDDDGDFDDFGEVGIDGWTTSLTYYFHITAPAGERHDGTEGTGARIKPSATACGGSTCDWIIDFQDCDGGYIDWLEFDGSNMTANPAGPEDDGALIWVGRYDDDVNDLYIQNNLLYDSTEDGIQIYRDQGTHIISNIIYNSVQNCIDFTSADEDNNIFNNTCANSTGIGFIIGDSLHVAKNNISINNTGADWSGTPGTADYNADDDGTVPGTNTLTGLVYADQFANVGAGTEDFHIKDTDADIYNSGVDLGTGTDIDGEDRDTYTPWDRGADEYVAGAPPSTSPFIPFINITKRRNHENLIGDSCYADSGDWSSLCRSD